MSGFIQIPFYKVVGNRLWEVVGQSLIYQAEDGSVYEVKIGTRTDGASTWHIPLVSEVYDGFAMMSGTLHDDLYDGAVTRKRADELLYEAMYYESEYYKSLGQEGINDMIRLRFFQGVRDFGWNHYRGKKEDNY